jgi:hypothetical protein
MDELIAQLTQRTGMSPEMARQAIETVFGFIKDKLPAPIAAQIESMIQHGTTAGGAAAHEGGAFGEIASTIGGMFGGHKE